jgi:hypothetical protein
MHCTLLAIKRVTNIQDVVESHGIILEYGSDFSKYNQIVAENRGVERVASPFDAKNHFLNETNGFWIIGRNASGALVHTQAVKQVNLHGASLAVYLASFFRQFPPPAMDIDFGQSMFSPSPGCQRIRGDVVYHGDLWWAEGPLYRGTGITPLMARLMAALTYLKWSPDYVFGIVGDSMAYRGLGVRESYSHNEPDVLSWITTCGASLLGFMVWNSREDIESVLKKDITRWYD